MNRTTTSILKKSSLRASLSAMLIALAALILFVTPALAAVPAEGTVYEGKSAPGIALGDTREQVIKAYGQPLSCTSISLAGASTCTFKVASGGTVWVSFLRSSRSPLPEGVDLVTQIRWSQDVSNWKTLAGVNTTLALAKPQSVADAYPNASVKLNGKGQIVQVRDSSLGIQVDWKYSSDIKNAQGSVSMAIFRPLRLSTGQ